MFALGRPPIEIAAQLNRNELGVCYRVLTRILVVVPHEIVERFKLDHAYTPTALKPDRGTPAQKGSGVKPHAAKTQHPLAQCFVHTATQRVIISVTPTNSQNPWSALTNGWLRCFLARSRFGVQFPWVALTKARHANT